MANGDSDTQGGVPSGLGGEYREEAMSDIESGDGQEETDPEPEQPTRNRGADTSPDPEPDETTEDDTTPTELRERAQEGRTLEPTEEEQETQEQREQDTTGGVPDDLGEERREEGRDDAGMDSVEEEPEQTAETFPTAEEADLSSVQAPAAIQDESALEEGFDIDAETEEGARDQLREQAAQQFTQATASDVQIQPGEVTIEETGGGFRPTLGEGGQQAIQEFQEQETRQDLRETAAARFTRDIAGFGFEPEDVRIRETEEGLQPELREGQQERVQEYQQQQAQYAFERSAEAELDTDLQEGEDYTIDEQGQVEFTQSFREEQAERQARSEEGLSQIRQSLPSSVTGISEEEYQEQIRGGQGTAADVRQLVEENPDLQAEDIADVRVEDGQQIPVFTESFEEEIAAEEFEQQLNRDLTGQDVIQEDGQFTLSPDVQADIRERQTQDAIQSLEQQTGRDITQADYTVSEEGEVQLTQQFLAEGAAQDFREQVPGGGLSEQEVEKALREGGEQQLEETAERERITIEDVVSTESGFALDEDTQRDIQADALSQQLGVQISPDSLTQVTRVGDTRLSDLSPEERQQAEQRGMTETGVGLEIDIRDEILRQRAETEALEEGFEESDIAGVTIEDGEAQIDLTEEGSQESVRQALQERYDTSRQEETEGPGTVGALQNVAIGVGEASVGVSEYVGETIDPASDFVGQGVETVVGTAAPGPAGETIGEGAGDIAAGVTEGAEDIVSGIPALPQTAVTAGRVGSESIDFTGEAIAEEGLVEGLAESGQAAGETTAGVAVDTAEFAIENPARTTGTLVGSAAIMGGAGAISSRAGTASRYAIQPGEEILGSLGFRGTRRLAGAQTAQRLFPNREPVFLSEEAAIRAGQVGVQTARSGVSRVTDRVPTGRVSNLTPSIPVSARVTTSPEAPRVDVNVRGDLSGRSAAEIEQDFERQARDAPTLSDLGLDARFEAQQLGQGVRDLPSRIGDAASNLRQQLGEFGEQSGYQFERTQAESALAREGTSLTEPVTEAPTRVREATDITRSQAGDVETDLTQRIQEQRQDLAREARDAESASDFATDVGYTAREAVRRPVERVRESEFIGEERTRGRRTVQDVTTDIETSLSDIRSNLVGRFQGRQLQAEALGTRARQRVERFGQQTRRTPTEFEGLLDELSQAETDLRSEVTGGRISDQEAGGLLRDVEGGDVTASDLVPSGSGVRNRLSTLRNLGIRVDVGQPTSRTIPASQFETETETRTGAEFEAEQVTSEAETGDGTVQERVFETETETEAETEAEAETEQDTRTRSRRSEIQTQEVGTQGPSVSQEALLEQNIPEVGRSEVAEEAQADVGRSGLELGQEQLFTGLGTETTQGPTVSLDTDVDLGLETETGTIQGPTVGFEPVSTETTTQAERVDLEVAQELETEQEGETELELETRAESRRETELFDFDSGQETDAEQTPAEGAQADILSEFINPLTGEVTETPDRLRDEFFTPTDEDIF